MSVGGPDFKMFDSYTYFNGMSAATFLLTSLIAGLQLCFDIFRIKKSDNIVLSHSVGAILLLMTCSTVSFILSSNFAQLEILFYVGAFMDILIFIGISCVGYLLYSNNQPSLRVLIALSSPYIAMVIVYMFAPQTRDRMMDVAAAVLLLYYLFYGIVLRYRERSLDDLYADPNIHSLLWIRGIAILLAGWWGARILIFQPSLSMWYDVVLYMYMTGFVLFAFFKVINQGSPVSRQTQEQIELAGWKVTHTAEDATGSLKAAMIKLLEEQNIYLNPDLTVDDVAYRLNTTPWNLSAMLHNEMGTSFCSLINEYRIERAKELLQSTDDKVEHISMICGFNSRQSFYRVFTKLTGKKPSDWRAG